MNLEDIDGLQIDDEGSVMAEMVRHHNGGKRYD